jgi:hypothetical protein
VAPRPLQGENNAHYCSTHQYNCLFSTMLASWRALWNQSSASMPVAFVQIGGAAAAASFLVAVLTEIHLCNVCSCPEILRRKGRPGYAGSHPQTAGVPGSATGGVAAIRLAQSDTLPAGEGWWSNHSRTRVPTPNVAVAPSYDLCSPQVRGLSSPGLSSPGLIATISARRSPADRRCQGRRATAAGSTHATSPRSRAAWRCSCYTF